MAIRTIHASNPEGYLAEYDGQLFVVERTYGLGPEPRPQPKPVKLDNSRPWAKDWPVVKTRYVSAGQYWRAYDLAELIAL